MIFENINVIVNMGSSSDKRLEPLIKFLNTEKRQKSLGGFFAGASGVKRVNVRLPAIFDTVQQCTKSLTTALCMSKPLVILRLCS